MNECFFLARLLDYPQEDGLLANLPEAIALSGTLDLPEPVRQGIGSLLGWMLSADSLTIQETYVEMVDRSRHGSLHLFEHVHGESRERGAAMIDLQEFYAERGLTLVPGELPDWLPTILESAATAPPEAARRFLAELSPVVEKIVAEHSRKGSLWTPVLDGVLALCGASSEAARKLPAPPPEPSLDELWDEPAVEFSGSCTTAGVA